jgi:hypothetical protein
MNYEQIHQMRVYVDSRLNGIPLNERRRAVAVAVARAISMRLPLPSSPVSSPNVFYNTTHDGSVSEWISKINEHYQLDVSLVRDTSYMFWKLAYDLAYSRDNVFSLLDCVMMTDPERIPSRVVEAVTALKGTGAKVDEEISTMICSIAGAMAEPADVGEF